MGKPRSIPQGSAEQVIVVPMEGMGMWFSVNRHGANCGITLSPAHALEVADELRFIAMQQMAEAQARAAEDVACACEANAEAHRERVL